MIFYNGEKKISVEGGNLYVGDGKTMTNVAKFSGDHEAELFCEYMLLLCSAITLGGAEG